MVGRSRRRTSGGRSARGGIGKKVGEAIFEKRDGRLLGGNFRVERRDGVFILFLCFFPSAKLLL